jgi:hypothetical protein
VSAMMNMGAGIRSVALELELSRVRAKHGMQWNITESPGGWKADKRHGPPYHLIVEPTLAELDVRLDQAEAEARRN